MQPKRDNIYIHTMKTYRSRISISLLLIVTVACFVPVAFVSIEEMWHIAVAMLLIYLLILSCIRGIKYVIEGNTLKVYSYWGIHQDIDIATITKMEQSRCMLSSPAASFKRLAIYYGKCDVIYISPRNQKDFINEINRIISSGNGI